ncbi:MAG: hypothetical protein KKF62_12605 [Bacteroidetes bacterium]|nr:hypothetical protein [Bacteroidota bacterium]MBU1115312.1 hypothetical protein [Bacteroidota bacterium]MBU1800483.1 hypothetical protein [Bacteroidota bacterium]
MDKLKLEDGYTITEALVGIIILGLTITLFAFFFNLVFSNPKILLRSEALYLADQEIENSLNNKVSRDTSYTNNNGNILVERKISSDNNLTKVKISVFSKSNKQIILSLSSLYKK